MASYTTDQKDRETQFIGLLNSFNKEEVRAINVLKDLHVAHLFVLKKSSVQRGRK